MIKRPKQVERSQKSYLSNEKYQDYAEQQFKTIYDYLDGKVLYEDSIGTNGNIVLNGLEESRDIEIIYCRRRLAGTSVFKSTGKIPYFNGIELALDINYYSNDTVQQSIAKLIKFEDGVLNVIGENTLTINNISTTNTIYITKVILY